MRYQDLQDLENNLLNSERKKPYKQKNTNSTRTKLSSTSVQDKFNKINTISSTYVNKIANTPYANPVISLYLDLGNEKTLRDPKQFVSYFNSFKTEALKRESSYLNSLTQAQKKSLKKDLDEIENLLQAQLSLEGFQSIILFKSNNELHTIIQLPLHIKDYFTIESSPFTTPLDVLLQEQQKTLVVRLNKEATFYLYQLGNCEELHTIAAPQLDIEVEKSRPEKADLHRLDHLNHYFHEINEYINKNMFQRNFDYLVVIGHEKTIMKKFINTLHTEAKLRLLETSTLSPQDIENNEQMFQVIENALHKHEEQIEEQAIQELEKTKGQGGLIEGLEQVIKTLNRGLLKKLYLSNTFSEKGYVCPERHYLSIDRKNCNICEKVLIPVRNCIDELVELAAKQNVETIFFTRKPESLQPFQNIAAIIYLTT